MLKPTATRAVGDPWQPAAMDDEGRLTAKQFQQADGVDDWRAIALGASAWFGAPSHAAGAVLVRRVAELIGTAGVLPDMDVRAGGVHVRIGTQGSQSFTSADVTLARSISTVAGNLGLVPDPSAVQNVQLTFDVLDKTAVMPFWQAALGYEQIGDDDLVDPLRRDPAVWFQQQDQPRPLRNRIHVDVARPHATPFRGEAVTAVGGRFLAGAYAVAHADAEGNEADIIPVGSPDELGDVAETADWRAMFGGMTLYPTSSPTQAAELTEAVARLADQAGLPLMVDLRPDGVTIDSGKDRWEEEAGFAELAGAIQSTARGMGLTADTSRLRFVQIGIDAVDIPSVRAFWRAVLGYEDDPRSGVTDIFDPRRLNLTLFFQRMSASEQDRRDQRNRIHVDVYVPDDQAQSRIDRALAAGGRIVYDDDAPEWWTIADPEGNEVDMAVIVGREEIWRATHQGAG
jgi:pterin-4a-carbinolamine dehydratase